MLVVQKKPFRRLRDSDLLASLAAIDAFAREHGYAPSIRELMSLLGLCSTSVVVYRLDKLKARGWLANVPKGAVRVLGITQAGRRALDESEQRQWHGQGMNAEALLRELCAAVLALETEAQHIKFPLSYDFKRCLGQAADAARRAEEVL